MSEMQPFRRLTSVNSCITGIYHVGIQKTHTRIIEGRNCIESTDPPNGLVLDSVVNLRESLMHTMGSVHSPSLFPRGFSQCKRQAQDNLESATEGNRLAR